VQRTPKRFGIFSFVNHTSPLRGEILFIPFPGVKTPGYDTLLLRSSNPFSPKSVITRKKLLEEECHLAFQDVALFLVVSSFPEQVYLLLSG